MMITPPKYRIKNFAGMGDNGVYFLENMESRSINGESILSPSLVNSFVISEDTANMSGLQLVSGMTQYYHGESFPNIAFIDNNGFIGDFSTLSSTAIKTHAITSTSSQYPDIIATTKDNILFTTSQYLGVGYLGTATGGSTTTLIDTTRNFTTTGISSSANVNKVYNITKGVEYTVTSVTTTTNTNDTINFSASTAPSAGDYYMAFVETKFDLNATIGASHFTNQKSQIEWNRQIVQVNDRYYILNGNYLARLNIDEATFTSNNRRLWYNMQATSIGVNQNNILIGGYIRNKGVLLLWDGFTDGFQSYIEVNYPVQAIKPYKDGWVFVMGSSLYFTKGYSITKISSYPDSEGLTSTFNCRFNGLAVLEDRIIVNGNLGGSQRDRAGIFSYKVNSGWTSVPFINSTSKKVASAYSGCLFQSVASTTPVVYLSFSDTISTSQYCVNSFKVLSTGDNSSIIYAKLPDKTKISKVELNLSYKYDTDQLIAGATSTVTLNYGDMKSKIFYRGAFGTSSSTTVIQNASANGTYGKVGFEVIALNGNIAGERTYITEIANAGTDAEDWTVLPAFSATPASSSPFIMASLKKAGSHTITTSIPDNLSFDINNFYSDKLLIEVVQSGSLAFDIHSINVYGE